MLRVGVLGELELELDGERLQLPASRRARSLLGLLALERRTHPRSELAARFWPDVLDESARTSLRGALAAARKALGPAAEYLETTRERAGGGRAAQGRPLVLAVDVAGGILRTHSEGLAGTPPSNAWRRRWR